ncbi:transketolase, partial [uncultured Gordonia sp.]
VFYDQNQISIEDDTDIALTEDVAERYRAYGWHVQSVDGGENVIGIEAAVEAAKAVTDRPSLICVRTVIGYPAPTKMNTGAAHGAALGADEIRATKGLLGFDPEVDFNVADDVIAHTRELASRAATVRAEWTAGFDAWAAGSPERKALFDRLHAHELPDGWRDALPTWEAGESVATRSASGKVLGALGPVLPELWGGSADLAGSNNTTIAGAKSFGPTAISTSTWSAEPYGRTLHFGIREHAMGAILSGIVLHGPTRAYGGTFLQFADYMRPAVRLAALMEIDPVYVWTHDSIGLGEDGPTHQPIEHLAALRAIPHLDVVRPADANETAHAWATVLTRRNRPAGLALTRQNVPVLEGTSAEGVAAGGYVLVDAENGSPDVVLIGTGSEVQLAVAAREELAKAGIAARVVSMPCVEWFDEQPQSYRDSVLPPSVRARVAVEAGIAMPWYRFVGDAGEIVSIEHYGASAGYEVLYEKFGVTTAAVVEAAQRSVTNAK